MPARVIYSRYEVVTESRLDADAVSLRTLDRIAGCEVTLYEWTPEADRFEDCRAILNDAGKDMCAVQDSCFSAENHLYLRHHTVQATQEVLQGLRARRIFLGDWKVTEIAETPKVPDPALPEPVSEPDDKVVTKRGPVRRVLAWAAIPVFLIVLAYFTRRPPQPPPPSPITIGFYESLGYIPTRLAAQLAKEREKIRFEWAPNGRTATLLGPGSDLSKFDVVLLPLSSLTTQTSQVLKDNHFAIVWVPSRTKGADKVLSPYDIDKDPNKLMKGHIAVIAGTPSATLFESYINDRLAHNSDLALDIRRQRRGYPDANALHRAVLSADEGEFSAVVVHEPYASLLTGASLVPRIELDADNLYVLFCRAQNLSSSLEGDPEKRTLQQALLALIHLIEDPVEVAGSPVEHQIAERIKSLELFQFARFEDLMAEAYGKVDLIGNLQFLVNIGTRGCASQVLLPTYKAARLDPEICGLIDTRLLQSYLLSRKEFSDEEAEAICSSPWVGGVVASLSHFESGVPELPEHQPWQVHSGKSATISALPLQTDTLYCVIGHADKKGDLGSTNKDIGANRAKAVIRALPNRRRFRLVPFSRGSQDSNHIDSADDRRVEIRRVFE